MLLIIRIYHISHIGVVQVKRVLSFLQNFSTHFCAVNSSMGVLLCSQNALISFPSGFHKVSTSTCYPSLILTLPCVTTVDVDILKPDTGALQIERPLHTSSKGTSASERQGSSSSGIATPDIDHEVGRNPYAEPVSEGEEDEDMDLTPGMSFLVLCKYNI